MQQFCFIVALRNRGLHFKGLPDSGTRNSLGIKRLVMSTTSATFLDHTSPAPAAHRPPADIRALGLLAQGLFLIVLAAPAQAQTSPSNRVDLEWVSVSQQRNTVQVPNDSTGSRFSMRELTGSGPDTGVRLTYTRVLAPRQELRLLFAPYAVTGSAFPGGDILFQGRSFSAGSPVSARYEFNSYRATWRYTLIDDGVNTLKIGGTGKIRDARIELSQGGVTAERSNVGFVPLLHLYGERRLSPGLTGIVDFDGLAGGPGRAIDLGLLVRYGVTRDLSVQAGWRMLDGGVDTLDQFNFARLQYWSLGVGYRF